MSSPPPEIRTLSIQGLSIPFTLMRSLKRKKTFALTLDANEQLCITIPSRLSEARLVLTLRANAAWIAERYHKLKSERKETKKKDFLNRTTIHLMGHAIVVEPSFNAAEPQGCKIEPHKILVNLPHPPQSETDRSEEIRMEILLAIKKYARAYLPKRMAFWANKTGLTPHKVLVTDTEKRWGSCNAQNDIRLAWKLILTPVMCIDYVIVHELCHIPHKNHGVRFWQKVASILPDYQKREKIMRDKKGLFRL